jgi:sigma-B regulation protein RsbU (phosphoserine phosphatase)
MHARRGRLYISIIGAISMTESSPLQLAEATPTTLPSAFTISSFVRSCDGGEACGDLVVYRTLADGTLVLVVVDVAGRGAQCGPLAERVAMNLLGLLVRRCRLERAVWIADCDFACEISDGGPQFVAVFAALLDPRKRRLRYVAAGHETALVLARDRSLRHLDVTGPAFGILAKPHHRSASVRFAAGDELIVVTDGVTDARDERGVSFGSSGVAHAALQATAAGDNRARALIDAAARYGTSVLDDRAAAVVAYPCASAE